MVGILIIIITVVITIATTAPRPFDTIFSNWNFDPLESEAFTKLCAFDHTGELLRREYLERLGKDRRQNRGGSMIDHRSATGGVGRRGADIDKAHLESTTMLASRLSQTGILYNAIPENTFGPYTQILQDEPDANLVVWIRQPKSTGAETTDQIAREHPPGSRVD